MRLRLVLPRRGGRAGLRRLTLRLALLALLLLPVAAHASPADRTADPAPLRLGLTEQDAGLLAHPLVDALDPPLLRLMVDWSQHQPDPGAPPAWDRARDGCMRGAPPCTPYAGIRAWLRAAAARGAEVLVTVFGTPDWAAEAPSSCDRPGTLPRSRAPREDALPAYRAMLRSLLDVAASEGTRLRWLSPWNEPNGPYFLAGCGRVADYTGLFRAAHAEAGGEVELVLGDWAGYERTSRHATGLADFIASLPDDVTCAATVAAQHAYLRPGRPFDPVRAARAALDEQACTRAIPLWVTETGAGGRPGAEGAVEARGRKACRKYDAALRRWRDDPGVDAAFHYTFREDPLFPTGLVDSAMTGPNPAYGVLAAFQQGSPATC